ncbi:transcription elongation factor GreAB [Puniceicoccales bacterium CK1056]|uniref:Transcription elongation factor GreA n=1 Tax=Oceanipulchritudo coccoides TaxID=2706888 RepID=A0A6B2LZA6_9BACT|nr:GreA/GreB family elongation factor [Oceanipulchritudo coccoides]NDV61396.1 transcription elongation factor GreAB [Oceanipulchritudo coccoides]
MNKEAIDLLIQKRPALRRSRAKLEAMQPGAYCVHRAWGLGQIKDYDERENRLIIDFMEGQQAHPMDPAFCVEKLEILAENDILVRAQNEKEVIDEMVKSRPTDLIADILERSETKSATALEIETVLGRLMGSAKFKKWWTQTKKALVKDPRIAVPAKKTEPFILRDEPVRAEEEVLDEFFETKAPKKKIALASKLIDLSVKHEDIKEELPTILSELATSLAETKQLNPGERLYGIWVRNDLARFIHSDVESLEPTSASIINASNDLIGLADQVPASHYSRFLDLIERTLPDQWERIAFDLLKNSSGKLTAECINFLLDHDKMKEISSTFDRWLVEQNLKAPVLTWILKNRASKKYAPMLEGLMTPRLLSAIFFAIDYEALQNTSTRRIPLADLVSDDTKLISDLLTDASTETGHDLAQTLILNQGFEDLSKKSLLARFIKLYPSIQSIVGGEPTTSESSESEELVVSEKSLAERKKEYEVLITEKIPQNKEEIAEARAHGDLRENAEYKMARQEQDILLSRKNELETEINKARTTDFTDATTSMVSIGSIVDLEQASNKQSVSYSILGAWDGDPDQQIVSYQTPLARALLGKTKGEQVAVEIDGHEESWTIKDITRWVDRN